MSHGSEVQQGLEVIFMTKRRQGLRSSVNGISNGMEDESQVDSGTTGKYKT